MKCPGSIAFKRLEDYLDEGLYAILSTETVLEVWL